MSKRLHDVATPSGETAARRAELDAITARIPALIAYADAQGRYLHVNETYGRWMGVDPAEVVGHTVAELLIRVFGERYWRRVKPAFERALAGEAVTVEAEGQYADRYRYVEVHYTPDFDEEGRVRGVVCLIIDITDRKAAEAELRNRTMLLDQAMEPVLTWVLGGAITYWNRAAEELYGYSRAEAVGRVSHELLRTRHPVPTAEFERLLRERGVWRGELVHTTKDGREVTVDSIHRLAPRDGDALVLEANRDLTGVRMTQTELREAQDRLRRALADGRVGVWEADLIGGALDVSEGMDALYGLPRGSLRRWEDLRSAIAPADREAVDASVQRAIRSGAPHECDFRVADPRHGTRWLRVQARAAYAPNGRPARLSGATFDITEQKEAEEQLRAMASTLESHVEDRTRELADANRELESFAYSVSHDLRAPLRSIEGFGELLLRDYTGKVLDERAEDYLRRMSRAAVRMGRLIDDLLNLSHIGRAALTVVPVDLSAMASQAVAGLRAANGERDVEVAIEPGLRARGDPGLLRVAIENLLSNAWKYTGKRTGARIEFGASETAGERVFFVRDNGVGFDMRHAATLFEPFHRLHPAGQFEGTGVGLATVERILRRHGGRIWAEAEEGKGATFYFTLEAGG
jgi:PAS domain S-box-containing protein